MIVVVDDRHPIVDDYVTDFDREGVCAAKFSTVDFDGWVGTAAAEDVEAIDAVLLGACDNRGVLAQAIKQRTAAAVIALSNSQHLNETLDLFASGVDDVVGNSCHVRELLARIGAILRRNQLKAERNTNSRVCVFGDGRDPIVSGQVLQLPRRELRILEYLASNRQRRVTKAQIFNSVYGTFEGDIGDNVIESHISKLRKRLRMRLGYDPIDSKRHLGYRLVEV